MELTDINFKCSSDEKTLWINISSVGGAFGQMYHIHENQSYICRIWFTETGWRWQVSPKAKLQIDDIQIFIDLIEQHWKVG